ncbi:hypothetical protein [Microcella pacifica]|nr:hypothetical protein [Microcella pacifica]
MRRYISAYYFGYYFAGPILGLAGLLALAALVMSVVVIAGVLS